MVHPKMSQFAFFLRKILADLRENRQGFGSQGKWAWERTGYGMSRKSFNLSFQVYVKAS